MKNLVRLSTGIVFILAILIAGGCCSNKDGYAIAEKKKKEVYIFVSSYEINGEIHLKLFDSNGEWAIDSLYTDVKSKDKVIWILDTLCGIDKITAIKGSNGFIFPNDPESVTNQQGKKFELELPDSLKPKAVEKYDIYFLLHNDATEYKIDPFLRVPDN